MEIIFNLTPLGWAVLTLGYVSGVAVMYNLMVRTMRRNRTD